jgi:excisionase family DNA binding protein
MTNPFDEIVARLDRIERLVLKQETRRPEPLLPESEKPMSVSQAADFLGTTTGAVYQLKHHGKIPHSKQGGRLYFFEKELRAWIKGGRRQTIEEIQMESIKGIHRTIA